MTIAPQKASKITEISDVEADCLRSEGTHCSISWTDNLGFRYHFWTDIPPKAPTGKDAKFYKNPPAHIKRGAPYHFDPRYLNPQVARNAAMIAEALAVVERDGLIAKLIESEKQKFLAKEAKSKETQRIATIQAAGVDLYEALKATLAALRSGAGSEEKMNAERGAKAAIAKAEGGAP